MHRLLPLLKYVFAVPMFAASSYFFFVGIHLFFFQREASLTRLLIGSGLSLLGLLISGYIMAPVVAEKIADSVMERITPLLDRLPGGRRRTDPPPGGAA